MRHHARFVQCWLTVENEDIPVTEVPVNLLVDSRRGRVQAVSLGGPMGTFLWRQQLVRNCCTLFECKFFLEKSRNRVSASRRELTR